MSINILQISSKQLSVYLAASQPTSLQCYPLTSFSVFQVVIFIASLLIYILKVQTWRPPTLADGFHDYP